MAEPRDDEEVVASEGEGQQGKDKPWYPYITKTQFEKFLSRLQGKIPEEIDRDYVRAIIRTPSMIYRFLRGVEAMGLIDDGQRPTDRLRSLVDKDNRRQAIGEVLNDLYPELLGRYRDSGGEMSDRDMVAYFRHETGMGNDSANKMKMFFKYLLTEAEGGGPSPAVEETEETQETEVAVEAEVTETNDDGAEAKVRESEEATGPASGNGRRGESRSPQAADRRSQGRGGGDRGERERGDRGERERAERGERDRGERERERERGVSNRPLTEAQRAYLDTLKSVLRVNVDGDWDDDMIRLAFDRLERLFDRVRRN
jgi:hypothetical protein